MKTADSRTKKTVYRNFRYVNCDDFAEFLQNMAMKGWHFVRWGPGMEFEKGEPEKVCYRVEVFPDASEGDYLPEQEALEYSEYCRAAGWTLADARKKFCIFRRDRADARPIVTEEERLSNIKKAEYSLYRTDLLIVLLILYGGFAVIGRNDGVFRTLFFDETLFLFLLLLLYPIGRLAGFLTLFFRFRKQEKLIRQGLCPHYGVRSPLLKKLPGASSLPAVLYCAAAILVSLFTMGSGAAAYIGIYVVVIFLHRMLLSWRRPSRDERGFYMVLAFLAVFFVLVFSRALLTPDPDSPSASESRIQAQSFPLQKEDYASVKYPVVFSRYEEHRGLLGRQRFYILDYGTVSPYPETGEEQTHIADWITYRIYDSSHPEALYRLWEEEIPKLTDAEDCTMEWNSEKALHVRASVHQYFVLYPGRLIVLESLQPLTPDHMGAASRKLAEA